MLATECWYYRDVARGLDSLLTEFVVLDSFLIEVRVLYSILLEIRGLDTLLVWLGIWIVY